MSRSELEACRDTFRSPAAASKRREALRPPIPRVGPGAYEIRVRDEAGAFRVIYVAIHVLHAFQKKTRRTSPADIELAARRYKAIGAEL